MMSYSPKNNWAFFAAGFVLALVLVIFIHIANEEDKAVPRVFQFGQCYIEWIRNEAPRRGRCFSRVLGALWDKKSGNYFNMLKTDVVKLSGAPDEEFKNVDGGETIRYYYSDSDDNARLYVECDFKSSALVGVGFGSGSRPTAP